MAPRNSAVSYQRSDWIFILLIGTFSFTRLLGLEVSPPGFYLDEAAGAANILCLAHSGTNAAGQHLPLFTAGLGGGMFTPIYLYTGMLWTLLFGSSIATFRALSAVYTMLSIIGVSAIAYELFGKRAALFTCVAAALSPWGFQFSRIAWDPPLAPCFLLWGTYLFLKADRYRGLILSGALFSFAAYSYPPTRVQVVLLLPVIVAARSFHKKINWVQLLTVAGSFLFLSIPLIYLTLTGELQGRFHLLSIFSQQKSSWEIAQQFFDNFWKHLTPEFLFWHGDHNLRHSTQMVGELGWMDMLAIVASGMLLVTNRSALYSKRLLLPVAGIISGIIPAALTWEALPHALRAIGSWPFIALLSGYLLAEAEKIFRSFSTLTAVVSVSFAIYFLPKYFIEYPKGAQGAFSAELTQVAEQARTSGQWDEFTKLRTQYDPVVLQYYLMAYGDYPCGPLTHIKPSS